MKTKSVLFVLSLALASSCAKNTGSDLSITRLRPPVQDAAGAAMTANSQLRVASVQRVSSRSDFSVSMISQQSVKNRFFSTGPTDILQILGSVDARLAEVENQMKNGSDSKCLSNDPVATSLTIFGETVAFDFQCYETISGGGILLFGKKGATWSIYSMIGAGPVAAKATDLGNGKTDVEIWGGVGFGNTPNWDSGSYTGFHLKANNLTGALEMTAGGIGVGFCGVTLKTDGTNIYAYGSEDGAGGSCAAVSSSCVLLSNLTSAGDCSMIDESHFQLTGLGRASVAGSNNGMTPANWAASSYPASGATLNLSGNATDMLHFGIRSETDVPVGVLKF